MRKQIVAGNWKMNCNAQDTNALLNAIKAQLDTASSAVKIMVAPTYVNLSSAVSTVQDTPVTVVAQNMHQAENGAYTGEISADMLNSIGVNIVILGHSERRKYFGETEELLAQKVNTALKHKIEIIFCLGESLEDREAEKHFDVVKQQVSESLFHLNKEDWKNIVLAYEPVWAIGTGKTASADQAQEIHAYLRNLIAEHYDQATADEVSILYGGSVKPNNAQEIFAKADVDGGLIGGAALKADDFLQIVNAFNA